MTAFLDHCTVGDCGEPATTWIASRVGEAFCPSHSPTRADQTTTWATCAYCAFQYRSGEASRYIFHLEGHVRTVKEELFIVDRKSRAMAIPAFIRQAKANAGQQMPVLVLRLNGQGPASIDDWPVVVRLADFVDLWRD